MEVGQTYNNLAVIMSVYKKDCFLHVQTAITSLLGQTYTQFDLYICIDGEISEDIDCYLQSIKNERIWIYRNDTNIGLAKSMNRLISVILPQQKYAYIARMDADDYNAPERFEKQIAFLSEHPDTDCVGTWAIETDTNGNEFFRKQMPITHDECFAFFAKRDCMIHPTVMFRRSYFMKAGLYPEDTYFGEDTIMWALGFANGCKFANLPEFLYFFRLNEGFFKRRRGVQHAQSILLLRRRVNKALHYGWKADLYALMYATAKLMPERVLNIIYKIAR